MDNLFSTHPSTENRIAELQRLAAELGPGTGAASQSIPRTGPWGAAGDGAAHRRPWG
jgi:heat shock protein HtpX